MSDELKSMTWREYRDNYRAREQKLDADLRAGIGPDGAAMRYRYIGPPMIPMRDRYIRRVWLSSVETWRYALTCRWRAGFEPERPPMPAWFLELGRAPLEPSDALELARRLGISMDEPVGKVAS